jgi:transcriptional regulator with XRE-family HTH domain
VSPLKTLRRAAGMSQVDLANKLNVTQPAVSGWERGVPVPEPLLAKVAEALGVDLAALRQVEEQPDPRSPKHRRRQRTQPEPGSRFVQYLAHHRTKAGVTVPDLARRSGVPESVLRQIESGTRHLEEADGVAVARVLNCRPSQLAVSAPGERISGAALLSGRELSAFDQQQALWELGLRDSEPMPTSANAKPKSERKPPRYPESVEVGRYRRVLGLTQAELATQAGISQPAISAMEAGTAPLQRAVWSTLATLAGVHPSKLGCGEWLQAV